jgi:Rieske Fe-S protein
VEPRGSSPPHTPPPSLWPVGFAVGVAILLVGLIVNWGIVLLGAVLAVAFGFLWVRDVVAGAGPGVPSAAPPPVRGVGAAPVPAGDGRGEAALPPMDEEEVERYPRAVFLEGATLGLGALIGGLVTVPAIGFAVLPAFVNQEQKDVDLGPLENFPVNQWRVATFMEDPSQGEVSRRTAFVRNNGDLDGVPSFTIIYNRCAHLGCPTQPNGPLSENQKQEIKTSTTTVTLIPAQPSGFGCPCHGGQYNTEGERTAGPPVRSLDRFDFSIRKGHLWIGQLYSVGSVTGEGKNAKITKYQRFYPGEHVDGLEQYLYPIPAPKG